MEQKPATTILQSFSATAPGTGVNSIIPNTAAFSIHAGKGTNHGPILYKRIDNGIVYLCRPYFGNFPCFHMDDRIVRNFHNLGVARLRTVAAVRGPGCRRQNHVRQPADLGFGDRT
jgi:hypothetical protein